MGIRRSGTVFIETSPADVHADAVILALRERGVTVFRFHPERFPDDYEISLYVKSGTITGEMESEHHRVRLDNVISAWYRRPNRPRYVSSGTGKLSITSMQVIRDLHAALEGRWLCSPDALSVADAKTEQLRRATLFGLATPSTILSNDPEYAECFRRDLGASECLVKVLRMDGVLYQGRYRFPLATLWPSDVPAEPVRFAPMLFQAYLSKATELRCIVIGSQVFAARIWAPGDPNDTVDVRGVGYENLGHEAFELPETTKESLIRLTRSFGIHFAAADMILTRDGEYVFLELNPTGQWLGLQYDTGLPLVERMCDWLEHGPLVHVS